MNAEQITPEQARERLLAGRPVRVRCSDEPDAAYLDLTVRDGMVISTAVAGWCLGTVEPLCGVNRPYLAESLERKIALWAIDPSDAGRFL